MLKDISVQNILFSIIFVLTILFSLRKKDNVDTKEIITREDTTSLKGVAFLMVFLSHIGYFLFPDSNFLFPFSIFAGVGGNLFLFLSGYGLAKSYSETNPFHFYKKRFIKLYIPLIVATIIITIVDIFSGSFVSFSHILPGITAIVPSAQIFTDFNSPLWFLTLLFIFYLAFPILFNKKRPIQSCVLLLLFSVIVPKFLVSFLPFTNGVIHLYSIHALAFPLGVVVSFLVSKNLFIFSRSPLWFRIISWCVSVGLFIYLSLHAFINTPYEELISLITMGLFLYIILSIPLKSMFLYTLGVYSYELYLLHWPLVYRHTIFYSILPAWFATYLYIFFLLGVAFIVSYISKKAIQKITTK